MAEWGFDDCAFCDYASSVVVDVGWVSYDAGDLGFLCFSCFWVGYAGVFLFNYAGFCVAALCAEVFSFWFAEQCFGWE